MNNYFVCNPQEKLRKTNQASDLFSFHMILRNTQAQKAQKQACNLVCRTRETLFYDWNLRKLPVRK